jgi:peptidyl-prolyl cis-trans isomerase D
MAVIGTIRKQSGLLIVLIGLAMVLFLLGDLFSGGASIFNQQDQSVGTIAGKEIDRVDYERKVQEAIDKQFGPDGADEKARKSIRDRIWQELVNENVLQPEYDKLGIAVSPDELLDQVKNTQPGSVLYQYFTDPQTGQIIEQFRDPQTGGLDSPKVLSAIQNLLNSENARDWLPIEQAIKQDVALRKYNALMSKGLFATNKEAQELFNEKNTTVTFGYAIKEFSSLNDEEITISDADIAAYYEKHKSESIYQMDYETRDMQFVSFRLEPSDLDLQDLTAELNQIKSSFVADSNDTAFVAENSDSQFANLFVSVKKDKIPMQIRDSILVKRLGTVYGPYSLGDKMMVTKLVSIEMSVDSVEASHILISVEGADSTKLASARTKLDSLKAVGQKQKNFAELAKEFSDDLGSGEKGGELGWFTKGIMVAQFEKASFDAAIGDMVIVETQFGVHLINITNKTAEKEHFVLASVDRKIEPSKTTADGIYKEASKFSVEHNTDKTFEGVDISGLPMERADGIRASEEMIGQIGPNSKEVVRWMYDNEIGAISQPIELEDKVVVCLLTGVREKGAMSLANATPMIKSEGIKEKKAEKLIADFGKYQNVDDAARNAGVQVLKASQIRYNDNNLPAGLGREPKLLGTVFSLASGTTSKPIVGNRGVYVVRLEGKTDAPADGDITLEKTNYASSLSMRAERQAYTSLQKEVGVEDNRAKYY